MDIPLSQLIFTKFRESAESPRLITLHAHSQFNAATRDLGLAVNPAGSVTGLQASKGVYIGKAIVGYTWYLGPPEQPSPVHFGDALGLVERFLWDEVDRQERDNAELPFLLGVGQGATVALAIAAAVPDLLSGVIAVDAIFPRVPGWDPPLAPLNDLPILLAGLPGEAPSNVPSGEAIAEIFAAWGGSVSMADSDAETLRDWLASQPVRNLVSITN